MKKGVLHSFYRLPIDEKIIYMLFLSVFMPFYITAAVIIATAVYIFTTGKLKGVFHKNGGKIIIIFTIYTFLIAIFNLNFIGVACSLAFIMLIYISFFARKFLTANSFERALNICCICGPITGILCFVEYLYLLATSNKFAEIRCQLFYFNSNYLATVLGTVIIICAYKVIMKKGNPVLYFLAAIITALGAYLTGSMFVWIEVMIGCAVLLMVSRQHQLLSILMLLAGTACIILYFIPELIPRIEHAGNTTNNRIIIWKVCLESIKKSPIFGHGFLSYFHIKDNYEFAYNSTHAHNIPLECILSFGVIGTIMLIIYFTICLKRVVLCRNAQSKYHFSSLIIALVGAIVAHGVIDLTFMWVQTGLLYCLLMGSIGIEEKLLKLE